MTRFLLNPTAVDGGAAPAPAAPPAAPVAETPPVVPTVSLPVDEVAKFYAMQRQFDELQQAKVNEVQAKEEARLLALAQKGEVEKAFSEFKAQREAEIGQLKSSILSGIKSDVINRSLGNFPFASDDSKVDVLDILDRRYEAVYDASGNVVVRDRKTGRPAADAIKEWTASPSSAHFRAPETTGGSGANASRPAPNPPSQMEVFANQISQGFGLFSPS